MAVISLEWNPLQRDSNALFDPWLIELRRTKPSIKVVPRDRKLKGDCLLLAWLIVTITSVFSWGMFVWAEKMLWECFACVITCFYISAASQFCLFPFSTGNQQWVLRAQLYVCFKKPYFLRQAVPQDITSPEAWQEGQIYSDLLHTLHNNVAVQPSPPPPFDNTITSSYFVWIWQLNFISVSRQ